MHIPILRYGKPYRSLNTAEVTHIQSGEPLATVSQANRGLVAKDLQSIASSREALERLDVSELVEICAKAGALFMETSLDFDGEAQSPDDYVRQLSGTTGMPESLCRRNMEKIHLVCVEMAEILGGLTRGLDLSVLDGQGRGQKLSYLRQADALGAVLPSNSPGVHSLWVPAIPLKVPLVLKPGGEEPWTPFRIAQAFIEAGCPHEAFSYYPTDHSGAVEILMRCGRSLLFGGGATVAAWEADPRVQLHGPGRSKVIFGVDQVDNWEDHLEVIVTSVVQNGGRSCINASGVWTPGSGREIAEGLAQRLAQITPRALDDPEAQLAPFTRPALAEQLSAMIDSQLKVPGAVDLTAETQGADRVVALDGLTFLSPTVIYCEDPNHPLANTEFLFPFVSVVEAPQDEILERIGSTLTLTALTEDDAFIDALLDSPNVERLNVGPIPTMKISWDQPHEGNLFEHLYRQRALQWAQGA
jgi:acyl-CoA reductase-like NAD-dependent aldehyde dehydrogenase